MAMSSGFATVRDLITFTIGAAIIVYTVIVRQPPADVIAIGAGVTLCGLPLAAMLPGGGAKHEPPPAKRDP